MSRPFIDGVVPPFNRARMMEGIVQSLAVQDYPRERYRVIVVDDRSSDETWPALQQMVRPYDNLTALHREHAGLSAAKNLGWRGGNGAWKRKVA